MDEYLILLLFLGILFVLFFYREDIFGKQQSQIIQPLRRNSKGHNKKHKKNNKHVKIEKKVKHKKRVLESESENNSDSSNSENSNFSDDSKKSYQSVQSNDTFPSIGSELSHGNNKRDDDSF